MNSFPVIRVLINERVSARLQGGPPGRQAMDFHRRLPDYAPTPLISLPPIAGKLGIGEILLKDESLRLGLPAFKVLGASWALWKVLASKFSLKLSEWGAIEELKALVQSHKPLRLTTATDGNHGRGVARMAALLGLEARIFVPRGTAPARIEALQSEGAEVTVVDGSYDDAVMEASLFQDEWTLLIQDTSRQGDETVNRWIIEGYSTMFWEIEDALTERGISAPDIIIVQIGVGSLAAAVVSHFKMGNRVKHPRIIGVEPIAADCALKAVEAGEIVSLPGRQHSIMAGLNCGTIASAAFPLLRDGIDGFIAVEDEWSRRALRLLAENGFSTSESGAAGLAGLLALLEHPEAESARRHLNLSRNTRVMLLMTEGVTDPDGFRQILTG